MHVSSLLPTVSALTRAPIDAHRRGGRRSPRVSVAVVEIRILGPLDVRIGETQVRVRPGVHRLILTLLALRNGATVGTDVLAELIWGDNAPTNPTNALHSQISHLRRALQPLVRRRDARCS